MVKRVGNLMQRIAAKENLYEAFLRAARGKQGKMAVIRFRNELDLNINLIHQQLLEGTFPFGRYNFFTIHDPKRRQICAASFPERVVFHAMMRICHPVFDDYQIYDSYASRIGKGTYKALERARQFCNKYEWFVKLDVCSYFDSIVHRILMQQLGRLFKDKVLLLIFDNLLATYSSQPGRGLPIGNLTSQYFANHYLSVADHYLKEAVCVPALVRYMDDTLLFAHRRELVCSYALGYTNYLRDKLGLKVHEPIVNRTKYGIPFLGYVVHEKELRLNHRSKKRFKNQMMNLNNEYSIGNITERDYAMRAGCMMAFINKATTSGFRRAMANMKGVYLQGL